VKCLGIEPGVKKKGCKVSVATKKEKKIQKELREELAAVAKQMIVALSQSKDPATEEEAVADMAGNAFGGQAEKKQKKG
jgi:hypothetical protein